ncbi:MAG TPA: protein translocase subunit SecD [Candidatus Paceibacterota bacterium]|nr:protein translocase subunit SecD [Candidatus Paceibacterota bacterium]
MLNRRLVALLIIVLGMGVGFFVYHTQKSGSWPFKLGLDLSGGTQLVYQADLNNIQQQDVAGSMAALRDTIARRVNLFGVAEPLVQTETVSGHQRLIVELPGVTDTQKAIALIGQTPVLEFRLLKPGASIPTDISTTSISAAFEPATLTGKDLTSATLQFQGASGIVQEPTVVLQFNSEGTKLFSQITSDNVGTVLGIFVDGVPITTPVINEPIPNGTAVISGNFTAQQAKDLAANLNEGALPVPITLISTETVAGTLGSQAVQDGILAGLVGVGLVMLFMVLWYRLPGLLACVALSVYIVAVLALFKLIPVTLTAAGIAAFILSIGMAVDANILIFERMKEELRGGKTAEDAIRDGFARAWPSIRDSNISSMITAVILFWFGTDIIQGFALVFGLGVLVSMLTAISISRTFLYALGFKGQGAFSHFFFGSGFSK